MPPLIPASPTELQQFRTGGDACDFVLVAENDVELRIHSNVFYRNSVKDWSFWSKGMRMFEPIEVLRSVCDILYTGKLPFRPDSTPDFVENVRQVAKFMCLSSVVQMIDTFLFKQWFKSVAVNTMDIDGNEPLSQFAVSRKQSHDPNDRKRKRSPTDGETQATLVPENEQPVSSPDDASQSSSKRQSTSLSMSPYHVDCDEMDDEISWNNDVNQTGTAATDPPVEQTCQTSAEVPVEPPVEQVEVSAEPRTKTKTSTDEVTPNAAPAVTADDQRPPPASKCESSHPAPNNEPVVQPGTSGSATQGQIVASDAVIEMRHVRRLVECVTGLRANDNKLMGWISNTRTEANGLIKEQEKRIVSLEREAGIARQRIKALEDHVMRLISKPDTPSASSSTRHLNRSESLPNQQIPAGTQFHQTQQIAYHTNRNGGQMTGVSGFNGQVSPIQTNVSHPPQYQITPSSQTQAPHQQMQSDTSHLRRALDSQTGHFPPQSQPMHQAVPYGAGQQTQDQQQADRRVFLMNREMQHIIDQQQRQQQQQQVQRMQPQQQQAILPQVQQHPVQEQQRIHQIQQQLMQESVSFEQAHRQPHSVTQQPVLQRTQHQQQTQNSQSVHLSQLNVQRHQAQQQQLPHQVYQQPQQQPQQQMPMQSASANIMPQRQPPVQMVRQMLQTRQQQQAEAYIAQLQCQTPVHNPRASGVAPIAPNPSHHLQAMHHNVQQTRAPSLTAAAYSGRSETSSQSSSASSGRLQIIESPSPHTSQDRVTTEGSGVRRPSVSITGTTPPYTPSPQLAASPQTLPQQQPYRSLSQGQVQSAAAVPNSANCQRSAAPCRVAPPPTAASHIPGPQTPNRTNGSTGALPSMPVLAVSSPPNPVVSEVIELPASPQSPDLRSEPQREPEPQAGVRTETQGQQTTQSTETQTSWSPPENPAQDPEPESSAEPQPAQPQEQVYSLQILDDRPDSRSSSSTTSTVATSAVTAPTVPPLRLVRQNSRPADPQPSAKSSSSCSAPRPSPEKERKPVIADLKPAVQMEVVVPESQRPSVKKSPIKCQFCSDDMGDDFSVADEHERNCEYASPDRFVKCMICSSGDPAPVARVSKHYLMKHNMTITPKHLYRKPAIKSQVKE